VQKYSCPYNKKKITRWLEDMNFIFLGKKTIFYSLAALVCKILFLPLENKIHVFALPCNILYLSTTSCPKFVINAVIPRVPFSDVDECKNADLNECAEHTICINQPGSYNCKCAPGFKPTGNEDNVIKTRCKGEVNYTLETVTSHKLKPFRKIFIDTVYTMA